jgi:outer membrane protein assembly factor BamB
MARTIWAFAAAALSTLGIAAAATSAADWPQYRGPRHDGSAVETDIAARWPKGRPKVLWKKPVGNAFGSFAVAGDRAFLFMERDGNEAVVALNPDNGEELWSATIDRTIIEGQGGNGPRSTPAVDGDRVYVLGTYFKLACLNAADGKVVWQHDLAATHAAQNDTPGINKWGNAASPLVVGDLVIVGGGGPGQTFLAFNKADGKLAWKSGSEKITHATPTPATIHGVPQVIFFCQSGLVSIRPEDGKALWRYAFPFRVSTASSPIVGGADGDIVYCSAGYGVGAGACRVTREGDAFSVKELWRAEGDKMNHWTTPVHHDGHLYGIYGFKQLGTAPLMCLDIATGEERWRQDGFGSGGGTVLLDGHVVVQGDKGEVTLVEATPDAYTQVGRFQVLGGKCWTMAVYADGRLYARSDKEAVCVDLGGE